MDGKPRLLDQMRDRIRVGHYSHYSIRTGQVYCEWVKQFIRLHQYRHPSEMGAAEVEAFLTDPAVRRKVSASTQNRALATLLFLYKQQGGCNPPISMRTSVRFGGLHSPWKAVSSRPAKRVRLA